ncbi:DUF5339 family protein [Providencia huaxiensis]|uniref:DUF5339 family protein n=1 Tax=Providencia huaxiensis TaxID=2027290 RepID=A0ABU2IYP1_9GAMM|nr:MULTISPECIES: DUF5339 family protein [Providencia]MBZ3682840.1 hypothetical protein [Providencia rettgeri]AXH61997.1 hypothetical protein CYG50_08175 [Providencia huaxiensis]MBQ0534699.1 hypothetical protein [Providencia huaxiensis]MBQ0587977.1 hypothetical protein [Providencia huaxiensis]MCG9535458.1 DUF5339 family protein [Providencia huaxiensis]
MKKYLLWISISINIILAIALVIAITLFFNMKNQVMTIVEQVKSGKYIEQVQLQTKQLIPNALNELKALETDGDSCEQFYQRVDEVIEYLNNNPEIIGAQTYTDQLSSVKMAIDKTPTVLKDKACKKGVSSINYIINALQPDEP